MLGESVVVHPLTGAVRVKTPAHEHYRPLAAGAQMPVGTPVDARAGKIVLQSARDATAARRAARSGAASSRSASASTARA